MNEEDILNAALLGVSAAELARRLGVSPRTVQRHAKRLGADLPDGRFTVSPEKRASVIRSVRLGAPITVVAKSLGISYRTAKRIMNAATGRMLGVK